MILNVDEGYSTGIAIIDEQHKMLFNSINALAQFKGNNEQFWGYLINIEQYASTHFETEEKWMQELDYPDMDKHVADHRIFKQKYEALKKEFEDIGISDEYLTRLRTFLVYWVIAHYAQIDKEFVNFIKMKKA